MEKHKWRYELGGSVATCEKCGSRKEQFVGYAIYIFNGVEMPRAPECMQNSASILSTDESEFIDKDGNEISN